MTMKSSTEPSREIDNVGKGTTMTTTSPEQGGIEAVKRIFRIKEDDKIISEELEDLIKYAFGSFTIGFVYGGVPAARFLRKRYIEKSQGEVYLHRVDAARQSQNAGIRGLIRYGWRWGWRVAIFVEMFQGFSICLASYRNKADIWNYAVASGVAGSLYKASLGTQGMIAGGIIGAMCGVPVGFSLLSLQKLSGENVLEHYRRRRDVIKMNEEEDLRNAKELLNFAFDVSPEETTESDMDSSITTTSSSQES